MKRIFATPPPQYLLPHSPIALAVYLVIEDAIRLAWVRIRNMDADEFNLSQADEDTVTQKLCEILVDNVYNSGEVEGFDDNVLQVPTREAKFRNYSGTNLDKMPDLHIGMLNRSNITYRSQDGIFIECKPIDSSHTVGVHYCNKGVIRFVRGDYAWAMTTAMMVGYAAEEYKVNPKLIDAFNKSDSITTESFPQLCKASQTIPLCDQTYISSHQRQFKYNETGEQAPEIVLRHLWLRR